MRSWRRCRPPPRPTAGPASSGADQIYMEKTTLIVVVGQMFESSCNTAVHYSLFLQVSLVSTVSTPYMSDCVMLCIILAKSNCISVSKERK